MEACLEGTGDVVPNVRMKFASLLPTMKATVRLPEDVALLERLNSAMASLTSDADPDVAEAALKVADAFRATHVSAKSLPNCIVICATRCGDAFKGTSTACLRAAWSYTLKSCKLMCPSPPA